MTRKTISINESVAVEADKLVRAEQEQDARFSFSSYVEALIRKDAANRKKRERAEQGATN